MPDIETRNEIGRMISAAEELWQLIEQYVAVRSSADPEFPRFVTVDEIKDGMITLAYDLHPCSCCGPEHHNIYLTVWDLVDATPDRIRDEVAGRSQRRQEVAEQQKQNAREAAAERERRILRRLIEKHGIPPLDEEPTK